MTLLVHDNDRLYAAKVWRGTPTDSSSIQIPQRSSERLGAVRRRGSLSPQRATYLASNGGPGRAVRDFGGIEAGLAQLQAGL